MPKSWTAKDERKYEHIKRSERERGKSPARAKEIAARTVNKGRREEGRTLSRTTQGTGRPGAPLQELSKQELYNRARERGVGGRSRMTKSELVRALRQKG